MRTRFLLILTAFLCILPLRSGAQEYVPAHVNVSTEKARSANGRLCWVHAVQEKQTLYGISKAYGVSVDEIYAVNPSLKESGLKVGTIILVPVVDAAGEQSAQKNADGKIAAKQTAQKDADRKLSGKQASQEAVNAAGKVPGKEENTVATAREAEKAVDRKSAKKNRQQQNGEVIHTVKWYESLKDIAEKYDTTQDQIMALNGLTSTNVKSRTKLRIPVGVKDPVAGLKTGASDETRTSRKDGRKSDCAASGKGNKDTGSQAAKPGKDGDIQILPDEKPEQASSDSTSLLERIFGSGSFGREHKDAVSISLLLPFNAGTLSSGNGFDFYSGFLLATQEMGQKGINVDLSVFDCASGRLPVTEERLSKSDIVVGPIDKDGLTKVLELAPEHTAVISPLDHNAASLAYSHSNFISVPTSTNRQSDDLANWIRQDLKPGDKVLLITEKGKALSPAMQYLKETVYSEQKGLAVNEVSYGILEGRNIVSTFTNLMAKDAVNRVVIGSDREAFVNDVVRNLGLMVYKNYEVVLYSPSKIRTYDTIEAENLHKVKTHLSMSYYIDYTSPDVQAFLLKYRGYFNTEPTQFAYQGYDIARYFISAISENGSRWAYDLPSADRAKMLQSDFLFSETESNGGLAGGYINEGIRRVIYDDNFSIKLVR